MIVDTHRVGRLGGSPAGPRLAVADPGGPAESHADVVTHRLAVTDGFGCGSHEQTSRVTICYPGAGPDRRAATGTRTSADAGRSVVAEPVELQPCLPGRLPARRDRRLRL
ncbi:hypothetical protein [Protofrankia symbiont of Coriaria ruscifolia]|uniref:hypothetical protein n=1 Tax=Protofrankia symbiont of Coriaria ruscifolia TaxID=1306542 RepID=UPI00104111DC|nr:hypothetical protein [Protofrankia symbiont of Coriaria ruscifolia]